MLRKPLSLNEATTLLRQYHESDIIGQAISQNEEDFTIKWISLAPYDEQLHKDHAERVYYLEDWLLALSSYEGATYDILLIATNPKQSGQFRYATLHKWLSQYNFSLAAEAS